MSFPDWAWAWRHGIFQCLYILDRMPAIPAACHLSRRLSGNRTKHGHGMVVSRPPSCAVPTTCACRAFLPASYILPAMPACLPLPLYHSPPVAACWDCLLCCLPPAVATWTSDLHGSTGPVALPGHGQDNQAKDDGALYLCGFPLYGLLCLPAAGDFLGRPCARLIIMQGNV